MGKYPGSLIAWMIDIKSITEWSWVNVHDCACALLLFLLGCLSVYLTLFQPPEKVILSYTWHIRRDIFELCEGVLGLLKYLATKLRYCNLTITCTHSQF